MYAALQRSLSETIAPRVAALKIPGLSSIAGTRAIAWAARGCSAHEVAEGPGLDCACINYTPDMAVGERVELRCEGATDECLGVDGEGGDY